jgi:AsmA protein
MPRTRTWIAWAAGSLLLLAVVAVLVLPRLLDADRVRAEAERRASAALGRPVTIGRLEFAGGPSLSIDARDVRVGGGLPGAPPLLVAARVRASVAAASLVQGPLEIGAVVVDAPRIRLHVDRDGRGTWEGLGGGAAGSAPPARPWRLAGLTVVDGELRYTDARSGADVTIADWQVRTERVALPEPFALTTSFTARRGDAAVARVAIDTKVAADLGAQRYAFDDLRVDADLLRPAGEIAARLAAERVEYSAADGAASVRALDARSLGVNLRADATATQVATNPVVSARLQVAPFEPRAVLKALGVSLPPMAAADALSRAQLAGRLEYRDGIARVADLDATLDATKMTGAASVTASAPRTWSFDLAADRLDADRYLKPARLRDRSPVELPLEFMRGLDASGTLRVGELAAGGVRLRDVTVDLGAAARGKRT